MLYLHNSAPYFLCRNQFYSLFPLMRNLRETVMSNIAYLGLRLLAPNCIRTLTGYPPFETSEDYFLILFNRGHSEFARILIDRGHLLHFHVIPKSYTY